MDSAYLVKRLLGSTRRLLLFIGLIALFLILGIGVGYFFVAREGEPASIVPSNPNLPAVGDDETELGGLAQKLTVNAQLQVNGQFLLAPSSLPDSAAAGTIVFDQVSNSLQYYNGTEFVPLASQNDLPQPVPQTPAGVTSLQGQTGAITLIPGAGISINGTTISSSGLLGVNGVPGDVNVSTANGIASISLPQSIAPSSSPTFAGLGISGNLVMTSSGVVRSNALEQVSAGQDININAGADDIFFTAGGRVFQFPAMAGSPQTICTTTTGCPGGGGGSFIELAPASAQADSSSNPTIHVNDTAGGNLIQLQAGGVNRFVVANNGNTSIGGTLTLGSALSVANGGTGATTLTQFGVLYGNGTGAIQAVGPGSTGECLIATTGAAPSWGGCPGAGGISSLTLSATSGTPQTISDGNTITIAAGTNIVTTAGATDTVTIATVASPSFTSITLGTALGYASGGTNSTTAQGAINNLSGLTTNGDILYHNGTNATRLPRGSNGQCLLSTGATVQWSACPGAGGVSSVNSFTGAITVQGTANQILVNNNTGVVTLSTPQDINTSSSPTFAALSLGSALTIANGGTNSTTAQGAINNLSGLTTNGDILYHNGTNAMRLARGTNGQCLLSTGSSIQWAACTGDGTGVTTVGALDGETPSADGAVITGTEIYLQSASNTVAGLVNTGAQTFAGVKTFSDGLDVNGDTVTDFTGDGLEVVTGALGVDSTVCRTSGNCVGGGGGGAPNSASYITVGNDATLSNERAITAGTNLTASDGGANGAYTLSVADNPTFSGLLTAQAGITVSPGQAFTLNGDAFTDLTGTGLMISGGSLQSTLGTSVDLASEVNGTLPVGSGGTGATTFTADGILFGNGTGAVQVTAAGTTGQCLLATTGSAPSWGTCTGDGVGVTTVGALNGGVANANGATITGSTIYLQSASTSFAGLVDTSAQTFAGNKTFTGSVLTSVLDTSAAGALNIGTTTQNALTIGRTGANTTLAGGNVFLSGNTSVLSGSTFNLVSGYASITGLNSGSNTTLRVNNHTSTGSILVLQDAATDVFTVADGGDVTATGSVTSEDYIHAYTSLGAGTSVGNGLIEIWSNGYQHQLWADVAATGAHTWTLPDADGEICLDSGNCTTYVATLQSAYDAGNSVLTTNSRDISFTLANTATDSNFAINIEASSSSSFKVQAAGSDRFSVDSDNAIFTQNLSYVNIYDQSGGGGNDLSLQVRTDSTQAFLVQTVGGTNILQVNTSANSISLGTSDSSATLLVLDTKNTAGDPTGQNGGMYYNSNANKFRCYENGTWGDCITSGSSLFTDAGTQTYLTSTTDELVVGGSSSLSAKLSIVGTSNQEQLLIRAHSGQTIANPLVLFQASGGAETARLTVTNDSSSIFFGYQAGQSDDGTDNRNTAIGRSALDSVTTGNQNTAVGNGALRASGATAALNTAIGHDALRNNTGSANIGIGVQALDAGNSGTGNIGLGNDSLTSLTSGDRNIGLGSGTLNALTSGSNNLAWGRNAGETLTSGSGNIVIGANLSWANTTGSNQLNIAGILTSSDYTSGNLQVGTSDTTGQLFVLDTKTSAGDPTGVNGGMYYNSNSGRMRCYEGGSWKNCITDPGGLFTDTGTFAYLTENTDSLSIGGTSDLSAKLQVVGTSDQTQLLLRANATQTSPLVVAQDSSGDELFRLHAPDNTAVFLGYGAGSGSSLGNSVGIGHNALSSNTSGNSNIAIGWAAMMGADGVNNSIAIGTASQFNSSGYDNISVGNGSLGSLTGGNSNTALGHGALGGVTTGSSNIALGAYSGGITSGSNNIVIGTSQSVASATGNNQLNIAGLLTSTDYTSAGLSVNGAISIQGNATLGDTSSDTVTFNSQVASNILPSVDDTYDLGSSTYRWRDLYLGPASLHIGVDGNEGIISYNTSNGTFEFNNALSVSNYINFGTVNGVAGYGIRDNNGVLEFKDFGGNWVSFSSLGSGSGGSGGSGGEGSISDIPQIASYTSSVIAYGQDPFNTTIPAGTQDGDLLVTAFFYSRGCCVGGIDSVPAGWARIGQISSNSNINLEVYYKIASGDTPGSTISWGNGSDEGPVTYTYRITGASQVAPINAWTSRSDTIDANFGLPAITTYEENTLGMGFSMEWDSDNTYTIADWSEIADYDSYVRIYERDLLAATTYAAVEDADVPDLYVSLNIAIAPASQSGFYPGVAQLQDDFNDNSLDANKWDTMLASGGTVSETGQELVLGLGTANGSSAVLISDDSYNMNGKWAGVELTGISHPSQDTSAYLAVVDTNSDILGWEYYNGTIYAFYDVSGYEEVWSSSYDSNAHRFIRIREASGFAYWETSADGETWVTRAGEWTGVQTNNIQPVLRAFNWSGVASAATYTFDNFYLGTSDQTVNYSPSSDVVLRGGNIGGVLSVGTLDSYNLNLLAGGAQVAVFDGDDGSALFHNSSNSTTAFQVQNSLGTTLFNIDTANSVITVGGNLIVDGTVEYEAGAADTATAVCRNSAGLLADCTSASRYKDNVVNLNMGLEELKLLQPVSYTWNSTGKQDIGFLAEQVASVIPQAVTYDEKGEVASFNYNTIAALLVSSVKELDLKVQSLEARVLALEQGVFAGNITVGGKIITAGSPASAVLGAQAGVGGAVSISGNDTAGMVSYVSTGGTSGAQIRVNFSSAYGGQPRVTLTPASADAAAIKYYVERTSTQFTIHFVDAPVPNATYNFDYQVIQ